MLRHLLACLTILSGLASLGASVSVEAAMTQSVSAQTGDHQHAQKSATVSTIPGSHTLPYEIIAPLAFTDAQDTTFVAGTLIGIDRAYE